MPPCLGALRAWSARRGLSIIHVAASVVALASAWTASAAPAPPFAELLRRSQATAPRLIEAQANVRAAQGLAEQAAALPNPTVGVEVEDIGRKDAGISQRQNTYSLSQPIELGGKRGARIGVGRAELAAADARQRQAVADFGYDLAVAYASAEAAQARMTVLADDLARAREDLRAARALVEAGKEADVRAVQAQAAAATAEAQLAGARADLAETLARLTSLSGSPEPFTEIPGSLLAAGVGGAPQARAAVPPSLAAAQADREAAARRVRVERAKAIPDVTVSVGARTYQDSDDSAVVVGVSAPLPLFDRNRGAVKAAGAQLAAADARLRAASLEAEGAWRTGVAQADAGAARLAAAEQAAQAAREGYRLARIGYEAGKTSLLELSAARRALAEAELARLEAQVARVRAEAQVARLSGRALTEDK
jgi:outer membrane protein, heavy metal efflux system